MSGGVAAAYVTVRLKDGSDAEVPVTLGLILRMANVALAGAPLTVEIEGQHVEATFIKVASALVGQLMPHARSAAPEAVPFIASRPEIGAPAPPSPSEVATLLGNLRDAYREATAIDDDALAAQFVQVNLMIDRIGDA